MRASQSNVSEKNNDKAIIIEIASNEGISGVVNYIDNNIDRWKKEPVKFGIIGRTATGKSSFVNLVRDVKEGDEGYAKVGRGNTTLLPTPYVHPDNKQIVYWDLPGVGTLEYPKKDYIDRMKLKEYDYFFIFFDDVLQEDDIWIAEKCISLKKPFCLVRSMVDKDIKKGENEKNVITNLRKKFLRSIRKYSNLKDRCKIFCISCKQRCVGEIDILFQHIGENLSSIKSEAVVYSLCTFSINVIEEKYKSLAKRVIKASLGTALIAATPIPGIDVYANIRIIVREIKHYIQVFGLTNKQIRKVSYRDRKQLRCRQFFGSRSEKRTQKIVTAMFIQKYLVLFTTLSISDIFLPIVGSLVSAGTTATIVYQFLNDILENLHKDAIFVYDLILPLPVRIIRTLRLKFETEGQEGLNKFISDELNNWKEATVLLAVIGESNSGKKEFINCIRRLKTGNLCFAEESESITLNYHPNNEGIIFIETDLYHLNETDISCYDDFFVFLNDDIYTDDISILHYFDRIDKSFSVTRTKPSPGGQDQEKILGTGLAWLGLDPDLKLEELLVARDEEINSASFRDTICSHLYKENENEYDIPLNVNFLSSLNISICEIDKLFNHMIQILPQAKSEAVLYALHPLSKEVIEEKFQSLKNRIVIVTTAATLKTALLIPVLSFPVKMNILVDEIQHYIKVFGFAEKGPWVITDAEFDKLRCREFLEPGVVFSIIIQRQLKVLSTYAYTAAIDKIADLFEPVADSVVSTANNAAIVYKCLTGFLEDFRHDALAIYDRVFAEYESSKQ